MRRAHWLKAGKALVTAAETGKRKDIEWAFEAIVAALDEEGWLPQGVSRARPSCSEPLCVDPLRAIIPSISRASQANRSDCIICNRVSQFRPSGQAMDHR